MNKYVKQFQGLTCTPDVLDVLRPISKEDKEITEAMGIIKELRKIVLKKPNEYTLIDLCAGNALVSAITAHLLPVLESLAIDVNKRIRDYNKIRDFSYIIQDILSDDIIPIIRNKKKVILTAVHPCAELAERVIQLANTLPEVKHVVLMPCCIHRNSTVINLNQNFDNYTSWCLHLWSLLPANSKFRRDYSVLSPKNIILTHEYKEV